MIDHEAVDALLAAYVLESLSGEDAAEAERLLTDHVPGCADCRTTLDAFQGLTGDLGMSAAPADPPETLLPRLHRSLDAGHRRGLPSWNPARLVAAAAAAIVVIGAAGVIISQRDDSSPQQQLVSQADLALVNQVRARSDAETLSVGPETKEIYAPGLEEVYVVGRDMPPPPTGSTYRLWIVDGDDERWVGDFLPVGGVVVLRVAVDPTTVDHLLITVEPVGSQPSEPGSVWAEAA